MSPPGTFQIIIGMIVITAIVIGILWFMYWSEKETNTLDKTIVRNIVGIIGMICYTMLFIMFKDGKLSKLELISIMLFIGIMMYIIYTLIMYKYQDIIAINTFIFSLFAIVIVFLTIKVMSLWAIILLALVYISYSITYVGQFVDTADTVRPVINAITLALLCFMLYRFVKWDSLMTASEYTKSSLFILGSGYTIYNLVGLDSIIPITDMYDTLLEKMNANRYDATPWFYAIIIGIMIYAIITVMNYTPTPPAVAPAAPVPTPVSVILSNFMVSCSIFAAMFFYVISITANGESSSIILKVDTYNS